MALRVIVRPPLVMCPARRSAAMLQWTHAVTAEVARSDRGYGVRSLLVISACLAVIAAVSGATWLALVAVLTTVFYIGLSVINHAGVDVRVVQFCSLTLERDAAQATLRVEDRGQAPVTSTVSLRQCALRFATVRLRNTAPLAAVVFVAGAFDPRRTDNLMVLCLVRDLAGAHAYALRLPRWMQPLTVAEPLLSFVGDWSDALPPGLRRDETSQMTAAFSCGKCQYDLSGLNDVLCPECGPVPFSSALGTAWDLPAETSVEPTIVP